MKIRQHMFRVLFFILMFNIVKITAQKQDSLLDSKAFGISLQFYPAGLISCLTFEKHISLKASLMYRLGLNYADRQDFSPYNDNEKGKGFGGSIGYRRYFALKKGQIVGGLHCDVWNMWINWQNNIGEPNYTEGQSYTLVIQPWIEGGYLLNFKSLPIQVGISTGFGREINVITEGKDVGQGWMNSLLMHVNYVFK